MPSVLGGISYCGPLPSLKLFLELQFAVASCHHVRSPWQQITLALGENDKAGYFEIGKRLFQSCWTVKRKSLRNL